MFKKFIVFGVFILILSLVLQVQGFNFNFFGKIEEEGEKIAENTKEKVADYTKHFQYQKLYKAFLKGIKHSVQDFNVAQRMQLDPNHLIKQKKKFRNEEQRQEGQKYFYFSYGSNMNKDRMLERDCQFVDRQLGILPDYELDFSKRSTKKEGTSYANIREKKGSSVEGALYELKSKDEIYKLDKYEGHPNMYYRHQKTVYQDTEMEKPVDAFVYIAQQDFIDENLKPEKWYLEHLLLGKDILSNNYFQNLAKAITFDDSHIVPDE